MLITETIYSVNFPLVIVIYSVDFPLVFGNENQHCEKKQNERRRTTKNNNKKTHQMLKVTVFMKNRHYCVQI